MKQVINKKFKIPKLIIKLNPKITAIKDAKVPGAYLTTPIGYTSAILAKNINILLLLII